MIKLRNILTEIRIIDVATPKKVWKLWVDFPWNKIIDPTDHLYQILNQSIIEKNGPKGEIKFDFFQNLNQKDLTDFYKLFLDLHQQIKSNPYYNN